MVMGEALNEYKTKHHCSYWCTNYVLSFVFEQTYALDTYNPHISHTRTVDDDILLDANKWPPQQTLFFLKMFLIYFGVGEGKHTINSTARAVIFVGKIKRPTKLNFFAIAGDQTHVYPHESWEYVPLYIQSILQ